MKRSRFRGRLAYDGTDYLGFQRQAPNKPTIQASLETAIEAVIGVPCTIVASGRTDAGVHARGQVIAFSAEWQHETNDLWRAINANMPRDIVLRDLQLAEENFHPRYDAISRQYVYHFYTAAIRDPLRDRMSWYIGQHINIGEMQQAAAMLVGSHDFATFGKPTSGTVTVRHMQRIAYRYDGNGNHRVIFQANAFLKRMIRSLMGTLIDVGQGRLSVVEFGGAFHAADRTRAGKTAPPNGLILDQVLYRGE